MYTRKWQILACRSSVNFTSQAIIFVRDRTKPARDGSGLVGYSLLKLQRGPLSNPSKISRAERGKKESQKETRPRSYHFKNRRNHMQRNRNMSQKGEKLTLQCVVLWQCTEIKLNTFLINGTPKNCRCLHSRLFRLFLGISKHCGL